ADDGPALLFEQPVRADGSPSPTPLVTNLFGTVERVAWGMGIGPERLAELGGLMAELRAPRPPRDLKEALQELPVAPAALAPRPPCRSAPRWAPISILARCPRRSAGRANLPRCSPGRSSSPCRHPPPPPSRRMSVSTACRCSVATARSCAGWRIVAAPATTSNG